MVESHLDEIAEHYFPGPYTFLSLETGHINSTRLVTTGSGVKFILQSLNSHVFRNPDRVLENYRIFSPLCGELIPGLIRTRSEKDFVVHNNQFWRAFEFIDHSRTILQIENANQAYHGAMTFGIFIDKCSVINPAEINETIPHFHDLNLRITAFQSALKSNSQSRGNALRSLIPVLDEYYFLGKSFQKALEFLPQRVVHNDTKPGNILFDKESDQARKVIDLDTVMPGLVITDFGDMVRSFTPTGKEDDPQPDSSEVRKEILEAITDGFLEATQSFLLQEEKELMLLGAKCIIFEQALRFLTDYLEGDLYYKTNRKDQNLDRGIHQLNILQSV